MADELLDPETLFDPPVLTDPAELREAMFDRLALRMPGFEPRRPSPLTQLISAVAEVQAEAVQAWAADVRRHLLELLGARFGIPRHLGAPARSTITVTAIDLLGHDLPAGTTVHLGDVELETVTALAIPAGLDTGRVAVQTVDPGTAANGADGDVEIDALDWLASVDPVTLDAPLADGLDPETDAAYSVRVTEELQLLTRTPILPGNFAVVARRHPRVGHAWVIDLYDPGDPEADPPVEPSTDNPRHVTIVCTDLLGEALEQTDLDEVRAEIVDTRETTYVVHVVSPTYVAIDVDASVVLHAGWDEDVVEASTRDRLTQVVSPAPWLLPPYGLDPTHVPTRQVHANELIAQADRVLGVDIVDELRIGDGSSTSLALGALELPRPGTITVSAAAPA